MSRQHLLALAAAAAIWLVSVVSFAQSLGSFLSPGELAEPHADLDTLGACLQCHEAGAGIGPSLCMDCHEGVRSQVNSGAGFHANLGEGCETCHSDHKGRDFQLVAFQKEGFAHHRTGFPLLGEHADVDCGDCHTEEPDWTGLARTCLPCHAEDEVHDQDGSGHPRLGECADCHDINPEWEALPLPLKVFDHDDPAQADYALVGEHEQVDCEDCHEQMHFVPVDADACDDCHEDPHHSDWGGACEDCHEDPHGWEVEGFDHDLTGYRLQGLHRRVGCERCHGDDKTEPLAHARCQSCHRDPHRGEFAPRDCVACHDVDRPFASIAFDHDATAYPLVGEHREVACSACHGEGADQRFTGLPFEDCADCHEDPHTGFFEDRSCSSCHDEERAFTVPDFDHALTGYGLEGSHASLECSDCHEPDSGPELPHASCLDCHADDNPHDESVAGDTCASCHDEVAWTEVRYDHSVTGFLLEDAHAVACLDCHDAERFADTDPSCQACHAEDEPQGHFDGDCGECHQPTTWVQASLGSLGHGVTGFALEGSHGALECSDCHDPKRPQQRVGSTCSSCHAGDDAHRNMVGDDCGSCHMQDTWNRTRWSHSQTGWGLYGSHRLAACQDCHSTGTAGTPRDCAVCHQAERPSDAIHTPAFVGSCGDCHKTYGWDVPTYPH